MNMKLGDIKYNFAHAASLIDDAMKDKPDVIVLPETWNTGFFPKDNLEGLCTHNGHEVKCEIGALAKKYNVNIVAGSVSNIRDDKIYNTAMVFDRKGECIASYDKTHLFTPMGEDKYYEGGDHLTVFKLDDISCGIIICYDLRFPEAIRRLALTGIDMLFIVSQWPKERVAHLKALTVARAIENQMFVACCNSCGVAEDTIYGGSSSIVDPLGNTFAIAGESEEILTYNCDMKIIDDIRGRIPVFNDRRPDLY